jgi:T-complex protein 1 subunit gamma
MNRFDGAQEADPFRLCVVCSFVSRPGGEILAIAEPLLERNFHPTVIVRGFMRALQTALDTCNQISRTIDVNNNAEMREIVTSAIGTKFSSRWGEQMVDIAIKAVRKVVTKRGDYTEVDVKRFVRIEKIPGGELSECTVLDGVMFNKDVTHAKMRRRIENPRILLLDCPLEYKKGESSTNVEIMNEEDFNALLRQEEEYVEQICANVSVRCCFCFLLRPSASLHVAWVKCVVLTIFVCDGYRVFLLR